MTRKGELFRSLYSKRGQVPPEKRDFIDGYLFQLFRGESCPAKLVTFLTVVGCAVNSSSL